MSDPFDALHEPIVPVDPDPAFAERLRDRLRRALLDPKGVTMTTDVTTARAAATAGTAARTPAAELPLHSLTPYIAVDDARAAIEWYVRALGARRRGEPIVMDDDRIGHAELAFGDSVLMLADEFPEIGMLAPRTRGGVSQSLMLQVADVDGVVRRAVDSGAELARPVADYEHGRNGVINDPYGHRWMISAAPAGSEAGTGGGAAEPLAPRHGDVGYVSLWLPDVARAADFYGAVLGWRYAPGSGPQGRRVLGLSRSLGMWGGQDHRTAYLCFAVDDVAAAVRRVRAAGGRAGEPTREPYGLIAECADDQGMDFALYEPVRGPGEAAGGEEPGGAAGETAAGAAVDQAAGGAAESGSLPEGEIAYLTVEVPDSARFRTFFGTLLGWEFTPGRVEDGWQVRSAGGEVRPMMGLQGGHERSTVVPMYTVDDIYAAVRRVRAAGGRTSEPEQMPYGISADCVDDQGSRFYLGQL